MDAVFHTEFHGPGDFAATGARDMSFAGLGGDNSNTPPGLFSFPQVEAPSPPTAPGPTPGLFRRLVAARVSGLAGLPRVPHNFGSDTMRDLGVSMEDRRQLRATVAELEFTYARLDVLEYQAHSLERLIDEQLEPYLTGEPAGATRMKRRKKRRSPPRSRDRPRRGRRAMRRPRGTTRQSPSRHPRIPPRSLSLRHPRTTRLRAIPRLQKSPFALLRPSPPTRRRSKPRQRV